MIRGRVIGEVWATRKAPGLAGHKLLLVVQEGGGGILVALDTLDAGPGDVVLLSRGSGGRSVLRAGPDNRDILCDAAVSLVVEGQSVSSKGES